MKLQRSLWLHCLLLAVASGLAWKTWTSEETPTSLSRHRVQVWSGTVDQLESIRFESERTKVAIVPHKDALGRWYEVRSEREVSPRVPKHIGAGGAPPTDPEPTWEKRAFVSVQEGEKLAEALGPLMALRAVGRVEGDREKEFGLDEPKETLAVRVAGKDYQLVIGGPTPGGGDRYARVKESGEVFAISGDLVRRLEQAESRLLERTFHDFGEQEPDRVKIVEGGRSRELVSMPGKLGAWASASSAEAQDETASNWMGKLGKLRVKSYLEGPKALEGKQPFLQVEYFRGSKRLDTFELFKLPAAEEPPKDVQVSSSAGVAERYVARSSHTRWPVELPSASAAELERDLASLFE